MFYEYYEGSWEQYPEQVNGDGSTYWHDLGYPTIACIDIYVNGSRIPWNELVAFHVRDPRFRGIALNRHFLLDQPTWNWSWYTKTSETGDLLLRPNLSTPQKTNGYLAGDTFLHGLYRQQRDAKEYLVQFLLLQHG